GHRPGALHLPRHRGEAQRHIGTGQHARRGQFLHHYHPGQPREPAGQKRLSPMLPKEEAIKVLYVDDEEGNLMAFRASFRRDFDVQVAKSAEEALAWLEVNRVHVVISDQRMPGMTGAEFLGIVRKRWPDPARLL